MRVAAVPGGEGSGDDSDCHADDDFQDELRGNPLVGSCPGVAGVRMRRKFITKQGGREAQTKIRNKKKRWVVPVPNRVHKLPEIRFYSGEDCVSGAGRPDGMPTIYNFVTSSACRPLGPSTSLNSTACPSLRVR